MKTCIIVSISLLLILSCSENANYNIPDDVSTLENLIEIKNVNQPSHHLTVKKDRVIVSNSDRIQTGVQSIGDISVDETMNIFIADNRKKTIHVFNQNGQFLQNLGGEGSGPGEFENISDMKIQGNSLFAFDPSQFQINFYSLDSMTFDYSEGLYPQDWSGNQNIKNAILTSFYDWGENRVLIEFMQVEGPYIYYYIVQNSNHRTRITSEEPILVLKNDENTTVDIELPNGFTGIMKVPFGRQSLIAVNNNRHIFEAWTNHFLIKEYDSKGTYLRALYYPYPNPPLKRDDINRLVNPEDIPYIKKSLNEYNAPETWPALEDLRVDDQNRLWVSTNVSDPSLLEWWILEADGKLVGRFEWPRNKSIKEIKNGFIYTVEPDQQTGGKEVIRYRVEMTSQDRN